MIRTNGHHLFYYLAIQQKSKKIEGGGEKERNSHKDDAPISNGDHRRHHHSKSQSDPLEGHPPQRPQTEGHPFGRQWNNNKRRKPPSSLSLFAGQINPSGLPAPELWGDGAKGFDGIAGRERLGPPFTFR